MSKFFVNHTIHEPRGHHCVKEPRLRHLIAFRVLSYLNNEGTVQKDRHQEKANSIQADVILPYYPALLYISEIRNHVDRVLLFRSPMPAPVAHYESFLLNNVATISTLESSLRSLTWFLPGRFKDAELASEARE